MKLSMDNLYKTKKEIVVLLRNTDERRSFLIPERFYELDGDNECGVVHISTDIIPEDLRGEGSRFFLIITTEEVDPDNWDRDLTHIIRDVQVERI